MTVCSKFWSWDASKIVEWPDQWVSVWKLRAKLCGVNLFTSLEFSDALVQFLLVPRLKFSEGNTPPWRTWKTMRIWCVKTAWSTTPTTPYSTRLGTFFAGQNITMSRMALLGMHANQHSLRGCARIAFAATQGYSVQFILISCFEICFTIIHTLA